MKKLTSYLILGSIFFIAVVSAQQNKKAASDHIITVVSKNIKPGQIIEVAVSGADTLNDKAWVGTFMTDANPKSAAEYKNYVYLQKKQTQTLRAPTEPGTYHLRLYADDPGDFLGFVTMTVESITADEYSIKIIDEKINPASTFQVKLDVQYSMDSKSWLGIFKTDEPQEQTSGFESYVYANQSGNYTLESPTKPGDYHLRFYSADPGYLITYLSFRVGQPELPGMAFNLNKQSYDPTEDVIITYTGHEDLSDSAWFGLFKEEDVTDSYQGYLTYRYLRSEKLKGQFGIKAPAIKGDYQIRMFYAETGPELLEGISFNVTSSLDDDAIKKALEEKGKMTLYGIYFDLNKSVVKAESYALIAEIAKVLNADKSMKISIDGHTDSQGDEAYNQKLSEKRSQAVKTILINDYGVAQQQLQAIGYGESQPVADNATVEGRAKNRRVELIKL